MAKRRRGEPPGTSFFRSDRFVQSNGQWYFTTREHLEVGPFLSRHAAVRASEELVERLTGISDPNQARSIIQDFVTFHVARFNK